MSVDWYSEHPTTSGNIHDWATRGKVSTHAGGLRGRFHPTITDRRRRGTPTVQPGAAARNTQRVPTTIHQGKRRRRTGIYEKIMEGKGRWEARKEIIGWVFNGATRCIKLEEEKQGAILKEITAVL